MRAPASPNAFENVRMTMTPSSSSGTRRLAARVLEVRLVDGERPRVGQRPAGRRAGCPGRQQNVSTGVVVADRRARELRPRPEERIRRLAAGSRRRRRGRRTTRATQQDQVVGAGAEHDVLRLDARVRGDRLVDARIAAVRVRVDLARAPARSRRDASSAAAAAARCRRSGRSRPGRGPRGARAPRSTAPTRTAGTRAASAFIARPPARARSCPRPRRAPRRSAARARARRASAAASSPA